MRSLGAFAALALLLFTAGIVPGHAADPFTQKLAPEKQAIHALNRLAFGPRPGDVEEVRRVGVEHWMRQQLHPERIPLTPSLETRLAPLATLHLATWQIFESYQPQQPQIRMTGPSLTQLLPPVQLQKLTGGTLEERQAVVDALAPDVRRQVLGAASPQHFTGLPNLQKEAERARQIQAEIRSREIQEAQRRMRPPLHELLTPEEARDLQLGTDEEKVTVLSLMDREKRTLVYRSLPPQAVPAAFRREAVAVSNPQQAVATELTDAKLYRATYSPRQLEEVLVDFWFNHFNVFIGKGPMRMLLSSYERDAIRPHVLGRFHDMLLATAHHPAMLFYLDNHQSQAPRDDVPVQPNVRRPGINENFARELMELHTLGVDGGYTQDDVVAVARVFTGWTIFEPNRYGEFFFNPVIHDRGEKTVLGHTFPRGGGENEGLKVIELLARHPSTARLISRKLAQRFVADAPPPALVDRMAATFTSSDGDLRAVMETLLFSREFQSDGAWQAKTKSPLEFVVSALRAVNAEVSDATSLTQQLAELGQPLYGKAEPTGYPNTGEGWASAAGVLGRVNFATALLSGQIPGVTPDVEAIELTDPRGAFTRVLGFDPPAQTLAVLTRAPGAEPPTAATLGTVLLASPDFQKR